MAHYSRRTYVHDFAELQPGDLVDISATAHPYWSVVDSIGGCEEDEYADEHCDGDCLGVIFHVDEGDVAGWHITRDESVYARLVADTDQDVIDAANEAHAAASAARAAQFEVVGGAA
jgi:hypothetical protein